MAQQTVSSADGKADQLRALHHWYGTEFREPLADVREQGFAIVAEGLDIGQAAES
jgi:hypothetical protein